MWPRPPPLLPFHLAERPSYRAEFFSDKSGSRQKFSVEEDNFLSYLVSLHGQSNWKQIASQMHNRTVRQCRERWKYYLEPSINRLEWTSEEDELLLAKHEELGPKWAQIGLFFHSRTDIDLKNRFHRIQRTTKRMEKMALSNIPSFLDVVLTQDIPTGRPDRCDIQSKNVDLEGVSQLNSKGQNLNHIPKRIFCSRLTERTQNGKFGSTKSGDFQ
jgi:hypothetical protein